MWNGLVERFGARGFTLLGVDTDKDRDAFRTAARAHGVSWRNAWQGSTGGSWVEEWNIRGYPSLMLLDRAGRIARRYDWIELLSPDPPEYLSSAQLLERLAADIEAELARAQPR